MTIGNWKYPKLHMWENVLVGTMAVIAMVVMVFGLAGLAAIVLWVLQALFFTVLMIITVIELVLYFLGGPFALVLIGIMLIK